MTKNYGQACPVAKSLELLGERWTLLVIRDLLKGEKRFQDLQETLVGVAPAVLSDRLKRLEAEGIVVRRLYSTRPRRAAYNLTARGRELGLVVGALAVWGSRHLRARSVMVHNDCSTPVDVVYFCPGCGERVERSSVHMHRKRALAAPRSARGRADRNQKPRRRLRGSAGGGV